MPCLTWALSRSKGENFVKVFSTIFGTSNVRRSSELFSDFITLYNVTKHRFCQAGLEFCLALPGVRVLYWVS